MAESFALSAFLFIFALVKNKQKEYESSIQTRERIHFQNILQ